MQNALKGAIASSLLFATVALAQPLPATSRPATPDDAVTLPPRPATSPTSGPTAPPGDPRAPAVQPAGQPPPGAMSIPMILERVRQLMAEERYQDAEQGVAAVIRSDPENFDARVLMARLLEIRQEVMTARTIYLDLVKIQPSNYDVNIGLGRIFVAMKLWRQAPLYLERADEVAKPDQKAAVKLLLAVAYRGAGRLPDALAAAEAAVGADAESYDARMTLISLRAAMEQFDRAAEDARAIVETATRKVEAAPGETAPLEQLASAQETLIEILRQHYVTLYVRDAAGRYTDQLQPGRERDAASFLQQVVDVHLRLAEVRHQLAYHDALVFALRASSMDPRNTAVLQTQGLLLLSTKQTGEAIKVFQKILTIDPSHAESIRQLNRLSAPLTSQPAASQTGLPAPPG